MRPLLLVARPAAGGLRSHLLSLLTRLDRTRWDIFLAAPQSFLDTLPRDLPADRSFLLEVAPRPSSADFWSVQRLAGEVRRLQKEAGAAPIVHAHGIRAGWICALARRRLAFPLIVTLHNIPPAGWLSRQAVALIARNSDRILCVSNAIAARVPVGQTQVIPNGIDLARFAGIDRSAARRQFGIEDTAFVVAAAARLAPEKGIDILLEAARMSPEMVFLIAGAGPEEGNLKQNAPANAHFLGRIENTPTLFAACDIAAVPSRSEGQGIAALEAMAAGAPVVAAKVGGLPEMVEDGVNGLLVTPGDASALSIALEGLRKDSGLRGRLGGAGQTYAQTHGDIGRMIRAIEQVYEEVARRSG